jgi:hypothetical protein
MSGDSAIDAAGFEVTDATGKGVIDSFELKPETVSRTDGRRLYLGALSLDAGTYTLKFGAIDTTGRRGSFERQFMVSEPAAGAIQVSDLMFGDSSSGSFIPIAAIGHQFVAMADVVPAAPSALNDVKAFLSLVDRSSKALMRTEVVLRPVAGGTRFQVMTTLNTSTLGSGSYVVTLQLVRGDDVIAERSRRFLKR